MSHALAAFDDAAERLFGGVRRAAAGRLPALARLDTPAWLGIAVGVGLWALVVIFAEPWGRLWGTGQDARCYWQATLADPYLHSDWNDPIAYVYSPAFLQLVSPLTALPWQLFMAAWTAILVATVRFLTGPRLLMAGLLFPFAAMEVAGGNVSLLLAAAIVLGFRWPAAWAIVLLTKITPGIGLLWFAVRREWGQLAIALGATAAIVLVSFVILPDQWRTWVEVVIRNATAGRSGTWASVPIPLWIRLPAAIALVVWGARTDRRWAVPVASMLALPAVWYGGLSMLLAVIPLLPGHWAAGRARPRPLATADASGTSHVGQALIAGRAMHEAHLRRHAGDVALNGASSVRFTWMSVIGTMSRWSMTSLIMLRNGAIPTPPATNTAGEFRSSRNPLLPCCVIRSVSPASTASIRRLNGVRPIRNTI